MKKKETAVAVVAQRDDGALIDQVRAAFREATSGLISVVKCGALLLHVRNTLPGTEMTAWLRSNVPEVDRGLARQFMNCAEATMELAKLRSADDLGLLLCAAMESLTDGQRKKRAKLEQLLGEAGSQRQLLLALGNGADEGDELLVESGTKEQGGERIRKPAVVDDLPADAKASAEIMVAQVGDLLRRTKEGPSLWTFLAKQDRKVLEVELRALLDAMAGKI